MAGRINRRLNELTEERIQGTVRYNWRVIWTFFLDGNEVSRGSKDFTNSAKADEFITLLRQKATNENKGIIVDKVDMRSRNAKRKRFTKGYRRKW